MSPEQEAYPQLVQIKEIAALAGFNPNNHNDLEVFRQRLSKLKTKDPTIVPHSIVGRRHLYEIKVAAEIVLAISGPIKRTSGTLADDIEVEIPQEPDFTTLSQEEFLRRSREQREKNRSKRQAQEQRKKEAEIIKRQMPIYFTNEVLAAIVDGTLDILNRNVHVILDRALKQIDAGNDNMPLADVLELASIEDPKSYFFREFVYKLWFGFNIIDIRTKDHRALSNEEKTLIGYCNKARQMGYHPINITRGVGIHFGISVPEELLHPLGRLNSQKMQTILNNLPNRHG